MKLRTIALASLLGAGLLMTSGCGDVEDAIADALKVNVVHLANGATNEVEFTIAGDKELVAAQKSKMFILTGENSYIVNNTAVDAERDLPKDSAHLYALCADDKGVMSDSATGGTRQIDVFNLSTKVIGSTSEPLTITLYNGQNQELATTTVGTAKSLGNCGKVSVKFDKTFNLVDVKKVKVNEANLTVPEYDDDVKAKIDSLNEVDFDIVIFDANVSHPKGTIVPLATATELGQD